MTRSADYAHVTVTVPARSALLAFTDGLCERRGETIDAGLERLRQAASAQPTAMEIGTFLDGLLSAQADGTGQDDIAVLGVQWTV